MGFTNTDAIICAVFALAEIIFLFIYVPVTTARFRKKVIAMGRYIPGVPVIVVAGNVPRGYVPPPTIPSAPYPMNTTPNPSQNFPPNTYYPNMGQMPQPMQPDGSNPPGFQNPDLPPPYPGDGSKSQLL